MGGTADLLRSIPCPVAALHPARKSVCAISVQEAVGLLPQQQQAKLGLLVSLPC